MKSKNSSILPKEKEIINKNCPCTYYDCSRHSNCYECQKYHHSKGQKTGCGK